MTYQPLQSEDVTLKTAAMDESMTPELPEPAWKPPAIPTGACGALVPMQPTTVQFTAQTSFLQPVFSASQMQEFYQRGRAEGRKEALEQAAKVCDARVMGDNNREDEEARRCASSIRALKDGG
jgi:hypothetical protein